MNTRSSLLLIVLAFALPVRGEFVEVTADIETMSWGRSSYDAPPMFSPLLSRVRCVVGTNSWMISAESDATLPETWFYTGSNLVHQFPKVLRKDAKPGATNDYQVTRTYGSNGDPDSSTDSPFLFGAQFRAAWLAYCSGPFLARPGRQIPLLDITWKQSWLYFDFIQEPRGFKDKVVTFDDDFGLPISMEVLSKDDHPLLQYRLAHDHGLHPASTNVHGWSFPREFRAIQYMPVRGAKDKWQEAVVVRGKLSSIKASGPPNLDYIATASPTPKR